MRFVSSGRLRFERPHLNSPRLLAGSVQRVPQRPAEALKVNLHHISLLQLDPLTETERVGAEEMDVDIARPPVRLELKMMMLQVGDGVRHGLLAGTDGARPQRLSLALYRNRAWDRFEPGAYHQLRTDRTVSQLRS